MCHLFHNIQLGFIESITIEEEGNIFCLPRNTSREPASVDDYDEKETFYSVHVSFRHERFFRQTQLKSRSYMINHRHSDDAASRGDDETQQPASEMCTTHCRLANERTTKLSLSDSSP